MYVCFGSPPLFVFIIEYYIIGCSCCPIGRSIVPDIVIHVIAATHYLISRFIIVLFLGSGNATLPRNGGGLGYAPTPEQFMCTQTEMMRSLGQKVEVIRQQQLQQQAPAINHNYNYGPVVAGGTVGSINVIAGGGGAPNGGGAVAVGGGPLLLPEAGGVGNYAAAAAGAIGGMGTPPRQPAATPQPDTVTKRVFEQGLEKVTNTTTALLHKILRHVRESCVF